MSILDKLKKNSTIKETAILSESKFFTKADMVQTTVPALNIALSGSLDGGLTPSLFVIAGKSKHFKTSFSLVMAKSYLDKYPESVLLFYDSEFGSPQSYFSSFGIDTSRVLHTPIMDVEELKFDIMAQLNNIDRNDKVIIIIDSIGNLASKKEVEDAINEKSVADMSRAKSLKSLFRMVTPYLTTKDIPLIAINHTYDTQEMYSKAVVSGGCLEAGTKLIMFDDSLKNIEDIKVGELVKTLNGSKPVTHIWDPSTLENGTPECYEIEFEDGYKCVVSENHPFLTTQGWIEAKNLNLNNEVVAL
jgi:RecA/RadA recombinase